MNEATSVLAAIENENETYFSFIVMIYKIIQKMGTFNSACQHHKILPIKTGVA